MNIQGIIYCVHILCGTVNGSDFFSSIVSVYNCIYTSLIQLVHFVWRFAIQY